MNLVNINWTIPSGFGKKLLTNPVLSSVDIFTLATAHVNVLSAVEDLHFSDKGLSAVWSFGHGALRPIDKQSVLRCTNVLINVWSHTVVPDNFFFFSQWFNLITFLYFFCYKIQ